MIVTTKGVCGGEWRIEGTRITVELIQGLYYEEQQSVNDILYLYPHLTKEQIESAISFKIQEENTL